MKATIQRIGLLAMCVIGLTIVCSVAAWTAPDLTVEDVKTFFDLGWPFGQGPSGHHDLTSKCPATGPCLGIAQVRNLGNQAAINAFVTYSVAPPSLVIPGATGWGWIPVAWDLISVPPRSWNRCCDFTQSHALFPRFYAADPTKKIKVCLRAAVQHPADTNPGNNVMQCNLFFYPIKLPYYLQLVRQAIFIAAPPEGNAPIQVLIRATPHDNEMGRAGEHALFPMHLDPIGLGIPDDLVQMIAAASVAEDPVGPVQEIVKRIELNSSILDDYLFNDLYMYEEKLAALDDGIVFQDDPIGTIDSDVLARIDDYTYQLNLMPGEGFWFGFAWEAFGEAGYSLSASFTSEELGELGEADIVMQTILLPEEETREE